MSRIQRSPLSLGKTEPSPAQDAGAVSGSRPDTPGTGLAAPPVGTGALDAQRRLADAGLVAALGGVAGLLDAATRASSEPKARAALRAALEQLAVVGAPQVRALSDAQRFRLGARLGDVLHALRASGRCPRPLETAVAEKLGAIPFLAPRPPAPSGPGLRSSWGARHDALLTDLLSDPVQTRITQEVLEANPHAPGAVLDVLASSQRRAQAIVKLARMYPGAEAFGGPAVLLRELEADLARGNIADDLRVGMTERGLSEADIRSFFGAFAEVRQAFKVGAQDGDDMQRTNWIHTRIEILHTLEAAHALQLSRSETLAALYGSLFSDAFKDAGTYSVAFHNRPGAEWVAPLVMSRHLDLSVPENRDLLNQAMRVAHEHQVTPPLFMSGAVKVLLSDPSDDGPRKAVVESIAAKLLAPMAQPQAGGEISFGPKESERLLAAGILGWAVPHDAPHRRASLAAIVGDVWQYVSPDGLMKYTHDLRDPEHPVPLFRDPIISMRYLELARPLLAETLKEADNPVRMGAAESSLHFSFDQGMSVLPKEERVLSAFMYSRQEETLRHLEQRVYPEVERRLRLHLGLPEGQPLPEVPYWNHPVSVSSANPPEVRASIDLVKETVEAVLADLGNVPLDPFGTRSEAAS